MLSDSLDIKNGLTSIIGSGGKTTLMLSLAKELSKEGKVIITVSTKIYPPEGIITLEDPSEKDIKMAFADNEIICVGRTAAEGKLTAPSLPWNRLESLAGYVLCEADGSKGLPLKAHLPNEPVIPQNSRKTVGVLGIKGIGKPIGQVCHRPEIFAALAGAKIEDSVEPEMAARVINAEGLCDCLVINQAENDKDMENAERIAALCHIPVWAGEIRKGDLKCLR